MCWIVNTNYNSNCTCTFSSSVSCPDAIFKSSMFCCRRAISSWTQHAHMKGEIHTNVITCRILKHTFGFAFHSHQATLKHSIKVKVCIDVLTLQCARNSCSCCFRFSFIVTRARSFSSKLIQTTEQYQTDRI